MNVGLFGFKPKLKITLVEAQRIRLATQIGSQLVGVLYFR
jgi:excinuclease UvrABC ATPase subunit